MSEHIENPKEEERSPNKTCVQCRRHPVNLSPVDGPFSGPEGLCRKCQDRWDRLG